jgi:hypothetical protein
MANEKIKSIVIILVSVIVLSLTVLFQRTENFMTDFGVTALSFFIIVGGSILAKKVAAYSCEADITTKFWEFYRYGFKREKHLKRPTPMLWLPIILTLFSGGAFWWMGILEFDVKAKPERVSRRHGLYRFSEMTERHVGRIALWGVIACLVLSLSGYLLGLEYFAKLATFYAVWSIIPISSLDGTKIFFGNRGTWTAITILTLFFLAAALTI